MEKFTQLFEKTIKKTNNGKAIPIIDKNGVLVHRLTVFEDIMVRNLDNLDTIALEVNDTKLTYYQFFKEVEKYMSSFKKLGLKENEVVSLCLPVGIEFICAYFALTTLGITVNALNIMFLLSHGVEPFLDGRNSNTLICYDEYYKLLNKYNAFNDKNLKRIIITGDAIYNHLKSDKDHLDIPDSGVDNTEMIVFSDFLSSANSDEKLEAVLYDENRIATLNYTSGTTGNPKCMGHSDLAPLFLIAAHDTIRRDEKRGDRTLLTIPLQHPTGLFYSMVLQMAEGKTLVLEPRYDKRLFHSDIRDLKINHAVQAKPFYAQLIQDRADGKIKPGDFALFRNAYSGGEGIPMSVCNDINDTLAYAGCVNPLYLGYGRSEEGSLTITPYNIEGRVNTCGVPLPGIKMKLVDPISLKEITPCAGARGEILINTPVTPMYHHYLGYHNTIGVSDGSMLEDDGTLWSRPLDIGSYVQMPDGSLSLLPLGRASDKAKKAQNEVYLFDIKELINDIPGVQECEIIRIPGLNDDFITAHIIVKDSYKGKINEVIKAICDKVKLIDAVRIYDIFGINATSGKCDREAMSKETNDYLVISDGVVCGANFINNGDGLQLIRKK